MRKLMIYKKKMLIMLTCTYAAILAISVTYAALNGMIVFNGVGSTAANYAVELNDVTFATNATEYGSKVNYANISADGMSMEISVDLRAPGDSVYIVFDFINMGVLPVEFGDHILMVTHAYEETKIYTTPGPGDDPDTFVPQYFDTISNPVFPIVVEGYSDAGDEVRDFEDIDGYTLTRLGTRPGGLSSKFGMAFIWDEDVLVTTHELNGSTLGSGTPITITVEFPHEVGDISAPATTTDPAPTTNP